MHVYVRVSKQKSNRHFITKVLNRDENIHTQVEDREPFQIECKSIVAFFQKQIKKNALKH